MVSPSPPFSRANLDATTKIPVQGLNGLSRLARARGAEIHIFFYYIIKFFLSLREAHPEWDATIFYCVLDLSRNLVEKGYCILN